MFKKIKNKYIVEGIDLIDNELIILLKDLETNEYIEITQDTLQNKTSKTDHIIYKVVMDYLQNKLLEDVVKTR